MTNRTLLTIVGASVCVGVIVSGVAILGWTIGLFRPETTIIVVNDTEHRIDLTCLWDNRDDLRPGERTRLLVEVGTVEDCWVDGHQDGTAYRCLSLDARDVAPTTPDIAVTAARPDDGDCNV
jgi:hypothetical protein